MKIKRRFVKLLPEAWGGIQVNVQLLEDVL